MNATPSEIKVWHAPAAADVGETYLDFFRRLEGPTWITVPGRDNNRRRAIVTLLHGNEPSGLKAIHHILASGVVPETNLGILIASVNAASKPPVFSHRFLPGEEDLNRCFRPPFTSSQRQLARAILELLRDFRPEAVIDTHNTSGHSKSFAVATSDSLHTLQLAQMFTRRLVVMDLKLGTLIEQAAEDFPVVTVEFGGFMDPRADQLARDTLGAFVVRHDLFSAEVSPMQVLRHPHRLEIDHAAALHYSASVQNEADITFFNTIDQLNFSRVEKGTTLGWHGAGGISALRIKSAEGEDLLSDYFAAQDGFIVTSQNVTLFMATTDPFIAREDCLLYVTPSD